ncbi:Dot/Icm T4SS effector AnkQ/LegA10 [Legionella qingyii]|uniref:Ankyrin repeat domain-containing protein n=1 Tax=Legionella qingyii TaxID=2184757 RepID=A0ABY0CDU0_9GAMM|nr:Dot/Icm T4SS effector AnkQ/LegA10 [Legionella qingyii]RUR19578.1 ankyrin repeat domain-containing protein [Legionella qingyii]RUR21947.1 ankyrin repeat domain-containing protein [Legionella qingyii]
MASSERNVRKIIFNDKIVAFINKPDVHFDEVDALLGEELSLTPPGRALEQLTDFLHLVSFIKTKRFSNPFWALRVFADINTNLEARKALVKAMRLAPEQYDKIYDLICYLAQKNRLVRYTELSHVTPVRFSMDRGNSDSIYMEEHSEWYLIFDVFGLCKSLPHQLIPLLAELLIEANLSVEDLLALDSFFKFIDKHGLLQKEIIGPMLPQLRYKNSIEKLQSLLIYLRDNDLLKPNILEHTLPLLHHLNALKNFFAIYLTELQSIDSSQEILKNLNLYCQLSVHNPYSYDDEVSTNTPLHQAIIERNPSKLQHALSLANPKFLLTTSYENTALVLACKLADKEAARHILKKMRELDCTVNHADSQGMTALHWARFYHFNDLSMELIAAGAQEELKAANGKKSAYFAKHQFTLNDFKIEGREIIEAFFKLTNSVLTDITFHADKIALNLNLTTPEELMSLYHRDEGAQIRSSNRFYLFFKAFRPRLIEWLEKQRELDLQSEHATVARRSTVG